MNLESCDEPMGTIAVGLTFTRAAWGGLAMALTIAVLTFIYCAVLSLIVHFAAERIREKLFRLLGDEVPYGASVVIDKYEEIPGERGMLRRIFASIVVVPWPSFRFSTVAAAPSR